MVYTAGTLQWPKPLITNLAHLFVKMVVYNYTTLCNIGHFVKIKFYIFIK